MDPEKALRRLIELAESLVQGDPESLEWEALHAAASELAETFLGLDEWVRKGGFLPAAWRSRTQEQGGAACPPTPCS